jgi:hypothetical protein
VPVPLVIAQLRVSERHAPLSMWKPVLQVTGPHAPHVVDPAAQLRDPVPLAMVQLSDPDGLLQLCDVDAVPHTAESVGVQLCDVTGDPVQLAVPVGVQLWLVAGLLPALQKLSATVLPRLSRHVTDRVCEPELAVQTQLEVRVCVPLFSVKLQVALRVCVPTPPHTAVTEQVPHEP